MKRLNYTNEQRKHHYLMALAALDFEQCIFAGINCQTISVVTSALPMNSNRTAYMQ